MSRNVEIEPLTDDEGEVRELTAADLRRAMEFKDLPEDMQALLSGPRSIHLVPDKEQVSLPVSSDVLARYRATGTGWENRMDEALREWIDRADVQARRAS